jgi:hypothetical protein
VAGSFILLIALAIFGSHALELERTQREALDFAEREGILRPALWRLDSKLLEIIGTEQMALPRDYGYVALDDLEDFERSRLPPWIERRFVVLGKDGIRIADLHESQQNDAELMQRTVRTQELERLLSRHDVTKQIESTALAPLPTPQLDASVEIPQTLQAQGEEYFPNQELFAC